MEIAKSEKLKELCRACLSSSEEMESIFTIHEDCVPSIKEMLASFCDISIEDNIISTQLICRECSTETLRAYNFKLKCERSDQILRDKCKALKLDYKVVIQTDLSNCLKQEDPDDPAIKSENESSTNHDAFIQRTIKCEQDEDYLSDGGMDNDDFDYEDEVKPLRSKGTRREHRSRQKGLLERKSKKKKIEEKFKKKKVEKSDDDKEEESIIEEKGLKRVYECPKCHAFIKTFNMMHKHLVKLHQIIVESAKEFDQLWRSPTNVTKKSDQTDLREDKLSNEVINKGFEETNKNGFKCLDCPYVHRSFKTVKAHLVEHRGERHIYCDECEYKCTHLTMLVRHKRIHTGERRFPCELCPYRAPSSFQLGLHAATVHSDLKPFACDTCPYTSKTKISLMNHIARKHVNRREHTCPTCGKGFNMPRDLRNHLATHTGARPHVCEHCGMGFTQKSNLEKHVMVVHKDTGERPFACPQCPYRGKTVYTLKSHSAKHSPIKPYQCAMCDHRTTSKFALKVHIRRHTGDKRHSCPTCAYSCYDSETLRAHIRIHTGERPFPCALCPYRSRTKQRLRNHMKSHLNEQQFSCQHCSYRSNYKSNLIVHIRKNCGRDTRQYSARRSAAAINLSTLPPTLTQHLGILKPEEQNAQTDTFGQE